MVFATDPYPASEQDTEETIWTMRKTVLIGRRWLSTREEKLQKRGKEGMERGEETRMRPDWEWGRRRRKEAEKEGRAGRGGRKRWGSDWEERRKRLEEKIAWREEGRKKKKRNRLRSSKEGMEGGGEERKMRRNEEDEEEKEVELIDSVAITNKLQLGNGIYYSAVH